MNTYFAVATAALAFVASVNGEACSATQQSSAYVSMVGLLQGTSLTTCASDSGYNMLYATSLPTDEERAAMCTVDACHDLIAEVLATNPPDCDLSIPTSGATMNVYELASTFEDQCSATETEAPVTETEAPVTETEAPVTETEAPVTETESPATETEAPSTETETPSTETEAPAATTATPAAESC